MIKKKESVAKPDASVLVEPKEKIAKLDISFPNEGMNKVVEKINEIIEKHGN